VKLEMIMQEAVKNRELISALADGQLREKAFVRTVEWLADDEEARLTWHAYHVVGDVLRSGDAMVSDRDSAFVTRLKQSLRQEAPRASSVNATDLIALNAITTGAGGIKLPDTKAANDSRFRWKLLAGLASLAAVSVIGWHTVGAWGDQRGAPQLAQVSVQTFAEGEPQVMIRDPQLDALLAAHKQFGGTSALQMPAGFLRNATFEGAAR